MTHGHLTNCQYGRCGAGARSAFDFQLPVIEVAFFEQLLKAWDRAGADPTRAAFARVHLHKIGCRILDDFAAPVGGAFDGRVVDDHQLAVHVQVQIQFAAAYTVLEALLKAGQGVFRCFAFGTAVAINQGHSCSFAPDSPAGSYEIQVSWASLCSRARRRSWAR